MMMTIIIIIIITIIIVIMLLDSCDRDAKILSGRNNSRSVYIPRDTSPQVSQVTIQIKTTTVSTFPNNVNKWQVCVFHCDPF